MPNGNAFEGQYVQEDATYLPFLPEHLRQRYIEGLEDSELTHLRRQIALADVRVKMLLETLDRQVLTPERMTTDILQEFPDLDPQIAAKLAEYLQTFLPQGFIDTRTYRSLERLVSRYKTAMADKRLIQAHEALSQLFSAIEHGRRDNEIWREIDSVMDGRRKLVEAEQRREKEALELLSIKKVAELANAIITAMRESVIRNEPDRGVQALILSDAQRIYQTKLLGPLAVPVDAGLLDGEL